jgi:hypothetical protein
MNFARPASRTPLAFGSLRASLALAARALCALAGLLSGAGPALAETPQLEPAPPGIDASELSRRAAEALAGRRTYLEAVLSVRDPNGWTGSETRFRAWLERSSGRGFLRVLEPPRQAGTGLLRLPPNLWRYAPRTASLELVDPREQVEPWLGSDFTLTDLLLAPTWLGTGSARLLGLDPASGAGGTERAWVIELPGGARAGGREIAWIETGRLTPLRCDRRDAQDALVSTLRFDALREVGGRLVPHRWTLSLAGTPRRESQLELSEIRFDPAFDDEIFTTRQLLQLGSSSASASAPDARLAAPGGSPP